MKISMRKCIVIVAAITFFFSTISYLPSIYNSTYYKYIQYLPWIVLLILSFIYMVKAKYSVFNIYTRNFFLILLIFDIFILSFHIFFQKNYLDSTFFYPVNLNFIIFIGGMIISYCSKSMELCFKAFIFGTIIVALGVYAEYFKGVDWINTNEYMFASKNGISMLMLYSIILLLYNKSLYADLLRYIFLFICIISLLMMRSRATLLGLVCCVILFILKQPNKKRLYYITGLLFIIFISYKLNYLEDIINNFLFTNRDFANLNEFSSGRISHLEIFIDKFLEHPFFGNGLTYLESFPLCSIAEYGVIGSIPLYCILILMILIYKSSKGCVENKIYFLIIFVTYLNGVFEQIAPFGPGVKCMLLWFIGGFLSKNAFKKYKNTVECKERRTLCHQKK